MMRLDTNQQMRLEQKLRLAPRMIQSMEILQLPLPLLEERIEQELEKNPVLEIKEVSPEEEIRYRDNEEETAIFDDEKALVIDEKNSNAEDFARLDNVEEIIDPDNFDQRSYPGRAKHADEDPKMQALANTASRQISLHEYLILQWNLMEFEDDKVRRAGEAIINNLDSDGYLRTSFEELARKADLPDDAEFWEDVLRRVQKLDPPGIAARDVKECLLLQLDAFDEDYPIVRDLIENYFEELQNQEFGKIAKRTGYSIEQIKEALEFIKLRLVLHPGLAFGSAEANFIIPDVIVEYDEQRNDYKVIVPENRVPNLYISGHYRKMLERKDISPETRRYIRNNMQAAQWIIDAIAQRRETLRKVVECVVESQKEFLENGPKYLKPLPMSEVADKIGVHIATVSRAVSGKYVQTPRGTYPLRSFFSGGTETESGESVSWDAVKERIKELIAKEDKRKPLSDDEIVEILKKEGITLARRTVAKYRKQLNIPSSHRRREK